MSTGRRIVISGASGLLGSHVLPLLARTHEVHAIVRSLPALPADNVTYHLIDLTQPWSDETLPLQVDAVWHLAQSPHMREYPEKAAAIRAVNLGATEQLLAYAKRANASQFALASTGGLYAPAEGPLLEASPTAITPGPLAYYFETKQQSEVLVEAHSAHFGTLIFRPFFMYGPGQASSMLIPRLIGNITSGTPLTLQGEDGMRFNPLHVTDAAEALCNSLGLGGHHVINLAGPEILTLRSAGDAIATALGTEARFTLTEGHPPSFVADISCMCERLSAPSIRFREGITHMIGNAAHV